MDIAKALEITVDELSQYDNGCKKAAIKDNQINIYNSSNKPIALVEYDFQNDSYVIKNSDSGNKIISGKGSYRKAVVSLLTKYWYAEKTS